MSYRKISNCWNYNRYLNSLRWLKTSLSHITIKGSQRSILKI